MRTWGAITVALALGAGSVGAACGSEASGTPDMGSPGDASIADATTDAGPQTFTIADAEPPPSRDEELAAVFVAGACGALRACVVVDAGDASLEEGGFGHLLDVLAPTSSRGVVEVDVDGGRAELVLGDQAEQPDAAVLVPRAPEPGATRTRRTAGARHRLVCDATGACDAYWMGAQESLVRRIPAVYGAVDLAIDYVGGAGAPWQRRTWVAGRQGVWGGLEGEELEPVPGLDVPPTAIARVGHGLVVVGRAGYAARLAISAGTVERIAVDGAPDLVDLDVRGDAWIALAAEGRVVVGVRATAQTCDLGEPLAGVSTGERDSLRIATRGGSLFSLGTRDGAPVCGRTDLGVPIDHLGVYGCGIADNAFVVAAPGREGTSAVLGWRPSCPIR